MLLSAAAVPWLIALACVLWRVPVRGTAIAVLLDLLYVWTDFPINYVLPGDVAVLPRDPGGAGGDRRFQSLPRGDGGAIRLVDHRGLDEPCILDSLHLGDDRRAGSGTRVLRRLRVRRGRPPRRDRARGVGPRPRMDVSPEPRIGAGFQLAVWMIPVIVLAVNAFWWLPGIWLASTKGASDFAFAHPEGVARRFLQIVVSESPIEAVLIAAGMTGAVRLMAARSRPKAGPSSDSAARACSGDTWRGLRARSISCSQGGTPMRFIAGWRLPRVRDSTNSSGELASVARGVDHLDRWLMVGMALLGIRTLGFSLVHSVTIRLAGDIQFRSLEVGGLTLIDSIRFVRGPGEPFLSSRPSPRLLWVIDHVAKHIHPGERLLYEEGGKDFPASPIRFNCGRFSGLLPDRTGVEVIGGPYLHASLKTNFTQFGEGMLFGRADWDRAYFVRYAKLYRPSAILCWSPHARRFCLENPDLVKVLEDDGIALDWARHGIRRRFH